MPFQQIQPQILTWYIVCNVLGWTKSGLHPSSFYCHTLTRSSCPIIILVSLEKITFFQWLLTVHLLFSLHHASHFFRLTSLITFFFLFTLLYYPCLCKWCWMIRLDTGTKFSSLNLFVMSQKEILRLVFTMRFSLQ